MDVEIKHINQIHKDQEIVFEFLGQLRRSIVTERVISYLAKKSPGMALKVGGKIRVHRTIKPHKYNPTRSVELFRISKVLS